MLQSPFHTTEHTTLFLSRRSLSQAVSIFESVRVVLGSMWSRSES